MILILVAKHPTKGKNQRRELAKCVGDDKALKFANAMLDDTIERLGEGEGERVLYYAPPEEKKFEERCERLEFEEEMEFDANATKARFEIQESDRFVEHALITVRHVERKTRLLCFCEWILLLYL